MSFMVIKITFEEQEREKLLKKLKMDREMKQDIKGEPNAMKKLKLWRKHWKQVGAEKKLQKFIKENY